ncbi:hypothetical protein LguiB_014023 [Lonicera macranthoides]
MHLSLNQSQKLLLKFSFHNSIRSVDCKETHGVVVPLNFLPFESPNSIRFLCSCNGLVCVGVIRNQEFIGELILWNPTTGEYKTLPDVQFNDDDRIQTVGFGYDSSTDDYKLVRITSCNCLLTITSCRYRVDLYSLNTNAWKKIREVPDHKVVQFNRQSGKWATNGSIYWGACRRSKIIAFDLKKEEFTELLMPDEIRQEETRKHVIELGGYLGVYYRKPPPNPEVLVWMMKQDDAKKQKWTKLMTLPGNRWRPFCSLQNGKVLLYKRERRNFLLINLAVFVPEGIRKYPIHRIAGIWGRLVKYTESIVSLNSR